MSYRVTRDGTKKMTVDVEGVNTLNVMGRWDSIVRRSVGHGGQIVRVKKERKKKEEDELDIHKRS